MKWMKAVVCTTLLALSGMAFCDEIQTESPRDYAFGRSLETSVPSQWYRVLLPLAVYEQSTPRIWTMSASLISRVSRFPSAWSPRRARRWWRNPRCCVFFLWTPHRLPRRQMPVIAIRSCSVPEMALRLCSKGRKLPWPGNIIC